MISKRNRRIDESKYRRLLATILCADIAGFSNLMGRNEEATLATLKYYFGLCEEIIVERRGRIFSITGDCLMAEFIDSLDAVRSAVRIQEVVESENVKLSEDRRMRLRIGINAGDVIADGDNLYGEEVNIATRLQENAATGGITISHSVYAQISRRTDLAFAEMGELKLRHIGTPVRAYKVLASPEMEGKALPADVELLEKSVPGFEGRPALAVLPFDFRGRNSEDEYIADGLAEDIITSLSNLHWFPVIARNSSFAFRDKPLTTSKIARALGVKYIVDGLVKRYGEKIIVVAHLIDAETGGAVWGHHYNVEFSDLLQIQNDIVLRITAELEMQIDKAEQTRLHFTPMESMNTWELVRKGTWHQNKLTRRDAKLAGEFFDEALRKDPDSVEALIQKSWWCFFHVWTQRGDKARLEEMEQLARKAMVLDEMNARGHMFVGIAQLMRGAPGQGRRSIERAIEINPSLAMAHAAIGTTYILENKAAQAIAPLEKAIRLNPFDLHNFHAIGELSMAHLMIGNWEQALENAEKSLNLRPGYWYPRMIRIIALAKKGNKVEAEAEIIQFHERHRNFSAEYIRWLPFIDRSWPEELISAMREAGFRFETEPAGSEPS